MSTPPEYTLAIDQGDDEKINIHVVDPDNSNADVDLTGCKLWFFVKSSPLDAAALISKNSDSAGIEFTTPVQGLAQVSIDNADTSGLAASVLGRDLRWEAQLRDSSGAITTIARGKIVINRDLVPVVS